MNAWAGQPRWRVLETAFGNGLDFLRTWQAWKSDPQRPAMLHVCSMLRSPLEAKDLLAGAGESLQPSLAIELASQWFGLTPGFHRMSFEQGRVLLTVCVGQPRELLRQMEFTADAVLLADGDAGWLKSLARLCRRGSVLTMRGATQALREGLAACGFVPGADRVHWTYEPPWAPRGLRDAGAQAPGVCVVVGGGLAGAAVAASMARRGWRVRVLDKAAEPASGASSLPAGLLAPHASPDDSLLSRLTRSGVRMTLQAAAAGLQDKDWRETGVLEHRPDLPALWHGKAGWIKPAALARALLSQPGISWQASAQAAQVRAHEGGWQVTGEDGEVLAQADMVVIAAAYASAALLPQALVMQPVRGQVSWSWNGTAQPLSPYPLNGIGHFIPQVPMDGGDAWLTGSTFVRDDTDTKPRDEEQLANLERLQALAPAVASQLEQQFHAGTVQAWTGVRCASADRRPLAGEIEPGLWLSTAMGSRGLTFALLCAELIAARVHAEPLPVSKKFAAALDVQRQLG